MLDRLDPDELFAEMTLIPVKFNMATSGLARNLDPSSTTNGIASGAQLDVPLYLATGLCRRHIVDIRLPAVYKERYRRKLNAGAECVSFKNMAPYFYEVGSKCNEFLQDTELSGFLARTFKTRYHELISKALNCMSGEEVLQLTSKLSVEESLLFEGGRLSILETERWLKEDVMPSTRPAKRVKSTVRL